MRDQPNGRPLSHVASIKYKRELPKLHRMKPYTLKRLKSVSPKWSNLFSAGGGWNQQENIIVSNVQSPSLHLSTYPFPIFPLSKIIIFILAASCSEFFSYFYFFPFTFLSVAVISCLLTHRLHVIYRHPNGRPGAVYFSISLRPPEHRHSYRAPSGFHHDTAGHSSVAMRSKALSREAFPKHLDL